jgi:hypothetical protein
VGRQQVDDSLEALALAAVVSHAQSSLLLAMMSMVGETP